jgi:AcrR family transcriptional regulator
MSPPSHVHAPKQDRSRRTLAHLVRAASELLAERGVDGTTVQDIVARAGSSVGSFYARFDGKEDLLHYLEETVWSEATDRWDAALAGSRFDETDLAGRVPSVVRLLLEVVRHGAATRRALRDRRHAAGPPDGAALFQAHVARGLAALLAEHVHEIAHRDPRRAADVGLRLILSALRDPGAWADMDDDALVAELSRTLVGYLSTEALGPEPEDGSLDFFDVWG